MDIAIRELWRIGFFEVIIRPGHPLFYIFWAAMAIGAAIQWILLKKAKSVWTKWAFTAVALFGLLLCEAGYQTITGWDQLVPLLGYWLCLSLLLGASLSCLLRCCLKRRSQ